jgi:hypothetical protein
MFISAIKIDGEQDVGRFRPSVRFHLIIRRAFIVGIFEIDVREVMTRRRDNHNATRLVGSGWRDGSPAQNARDG